MSDNLPSAFRHWSLESTLPALPQHLLLSRSRLIARSDVAAQRHRADCHTCDYIRVARPPLPSLSPRSAAASCMVVGRLYLAAGCLTLPARGQWHQSVHSSKERGRVLAGALPDLRVRSSMEHEYKLQEREGNFCRLWRVED